VAFVNGKGRVHLRRPPDPAPADIGRPTDAAGVLSRPTKLSLSAGVVFALTADGVYRWMEGAGWERLGDRPWTCSRAATAR
jgi:hypothetical protein